MPVMQQWHKGPRPETAATRQNEIKESRHKAAATSWKREDNQHDLQEDHRAGDREVSRRDFQWVAKNQELDLVEGPTPFEMEEGRRNYRYSRSQQCRSTGTNCYRRKKKTLDDCDNLD
jgi:hypothetical protein